MSDKKKTLILCTGNSARSQMAEGILRHLAGNYMDVYSAGTKPGTVNPFAIAAMQELGIDISKQRSKSLDEFIGQRFDYLITVCDNAKESCPAFPSWGKRIHWSFDDPAAAAGDAEHCLHIFRCIRDQIKDKMTAFVQEMALTN